MMDPTPYLFYLFAGLTLLFGLGVIVNRNALNSALCLVLCIVSLAGLFVLLHAFFLSAVQIIIYAGAVMVLFLFVIMLLDAKSEQRKQMGRLRWFAGAFLVGFLINYLIKATLASPAMQHDLLTTEGSTANIGRMLISNYFLPFELVSILLLSAIVGVILYSVRGSK